jgi:two-component system response regulator FlrC
MKSIKQLLVVDDDAAMRTAMTQVLQRASYAVDSVESGERALGRLGVKAYDALISDVRMPGIDGGTLLTRAIEKQPQLKVVLVTAFGTIQQAVDAVRRGACDYLLKPFAPETLLAALERALDGPGSSSAGPGHLPAARPIGQDPLFLDMLQQAERAARSDATVLLMGESGTGKELIARYIHEQSPRAHGPFVAINCAALPSELLEAELFGVRRGAFTGADRDRTGHFERAHGGTLLLDEIGDLPLGLQAKLLRALEERAVTSLGAGPARPIDIRVIAATHQDLSEAVAAGRFRRDLYFRLCVVPLELPPLRARASDVPALAKHLIGEICTRLGRAEVSLDPQAIARLQRAPWPGNVRELRNVLERAAVLDCSGVITTSDLFLDETAWHRPAEGIRAGVTVAQAERRLIETTLEATGGHRTRAAELLGISVRTLRNKLREYRDVNPSTANGTDCRGNRRISAKPEEFSRHVVCSERSKHLPADRRGLTDATGESA